MFVEGCTVLYVGYEKHCLSELICYSKHAKAVHDFPIHRNSVLDSLVLYATASNLPKEFDATLSAQATLYMSTFEELDEGNFQCLNVISHLISAQEAAELLDLVAARLISVKLGLLLPGHALLCFGLYHF